MNRARLNSPLVLRCTAQYLCAALLALALTACADAPRVPDWRLSATDSLKRATTAYLSGNTRVADLEFKRAVDEVRQTARPDLLARAGLVQCAAWVAALNPAPCTAYAALASDAAAPERAYASYLNAQGDAASAALLPAAHRQLVASPTVAALAGVTDPVSQLVAAGVLYKRGLATDAVVSQALQTASEQGYARALMAWLLVAQQRAKEANNSTEVARLQRRLELLK